MGWKTAELVHDANVPPLYDPLLRRLTGDGLPNLLAARAEVLAALSEGDGALPAAPPCDDSLDAAQVPSVAAGARHNRVLAEVDHDGFFFAADPADAPFFNRRLERHPRHHNLLDIVLCEGRVMIRKRFRRARLGVRAWGTKRVPLQQWLRRSFWVTAGLFLYNEAAALLRLRDLPCVPRLRRIDLQDRALYVDFIGGESLRHCAAAAGAAVHDLDLARADEPVLSGREMEKREVALYDATGPSGDYRREIAAMSLLVNDRGVAPLDIKLGNFIRGAVTGRLYWIDFEVSRIASQPRWIDDLFLERQLLDELFDFTKRGYQF